MRNGERDRAHMRAEETRQRGDISGWREEGSGRGSAKQKMLNRHLPRVVYNRVYDDLGLAMETVRDWGCEVGGE